MSFTKLADELVALATTTTPAEVGAGAGAGADDSEGGDTDLLKSFSFTLEDGTVVEAADGTALVKSLVEHQKKTEADLTKALGAMATMLKSMNAQIAALSGSGRGRKATLSMPATQVDDKPADKKIDGNELMAKAQSAYQAGRIQGLDVSVIETYLNRNMTPPEHLIKALG